MKSFNNSSNGCSESFTDQTQDQQSISPDLPHVDLFRPTSSNPKPIFEIGESILLVAHNSETRIEEMVLNIYTDLQNQFDDVYIFTDDIRSRDFNDGLIESRYKNITNHLFSIDSFKSITTKIRTAPKASHLLIIDCLVTNKLNSKDFLNIMFNGRSYGMTLMMITRYTLGLQAELRTQFDHVIIGGLQSNNYISLTKRAYEFYLGMFPSFACIRKFQQEMAIDDVIHVIRTARNGITNQVKVYPISNTDLDRQIKFCPAVNIDPNINAADIQEYKDLLFRINNTINELIEIRNIIKSKI